MKLLKVYEYSDRDYFRFLKTKFDLMDIDYAYDNYYSVNKLKLRLKSNKKIDKDYLAPLIKEFQKYYWYINYDNFMNSTFFIIEMNATQIKKYFKKFDLEMNTGKYNL